jgi:hypothetical protein
MSVLNSIIRGAKSMVRGPRKPAATTPQPRTVGKKKTPGQHSVLSLADKLRANNARNAAELAK